jgi:hypothetical protein
MLKCYVTQTKDQNLFLKEFGKRGRSKMLAQAKETLETSEIVM